MYDVVSYLFFLWEEEGMVVYSNWLTSQGFWYKKPWFTTGILGDRSKVSSKNNSSLALKKVGLAIPCFGINLGKDVYHQPRSAFEIERKKRHFHFWKKHVTLKYLCFKNVLPLFLKKTCLPFRERKKNYTNFHSRVKNMLTKIFNNKNRRKLPLNPKLPCDDLRIRKGSRSTLLI